MYRNFDEIKEDIFRRLSEFESEPDGMLAEEADSLAPVYTNQIISDWQQMPSEFDDSWREYGWDEFLEQGGIIGLMRIDLVHYYTSLATRAYEELTAQSPDE